MKSHCLNTGTIIACIAAGLIWFFFTHSPVLALESYLEGTTLFSDDFTQGNLNKWTVLSGNWGVDSLKRLYGYAVGTLKTGRLTPTSATWDNYRIEVDVQNDDGVDEGVGFRFTDTGNAYELNLRHHVNTPGTDTPEVKLHKAVGGVSQVIFSTHNITLEHYTPYHVKIEVVGEHIQVWIGSQLIIDLTDSGTPLKTGGIALSYWTGDTMSVNVRFDNIKVIQLNKISKTPVIFIPGLGGSELKTAEVINWSQDNGHGGTFSHIYPGNEKVWANENEAMKPGNDDYFDILRLKPDGITPEANLTLTGNLTSQAYPDIDNFFSDNGYTKGTDYFVFTYDWRKDINSNLATLDTLVNQATTSANQAQANLIGHSLGGLIARSYIQSSSSAQKVKKLIGLGTPHLGAVASLKLLIYGESLYKYLLYFIPIGIEASENKDLAQNYYSVFQLLPSQKYFDFYTNTNPLIDERDIDNNSVKGPLNYSQTKDLLTNLNYNSLLIQGAETFHSNFDTKLSNSTTVSLHQCTGVGWPTLGQIKEYYLITWPFNLFPKKDEIFIDGDDTVPTYSSSLTNGSINLTASTTQIYSPQHHIELINKDGVCMKTVKNWLLDDPTLPSGASTQKTENMEGTQITVDEDAILEMVDSLGRITKILDSGILQKDIPDVILDQLDNTQTAFIPKSSGKVTAIVTRKSTKTTPVSTTVRKYKQSKVSKTSIYPKLNVDTTTTLQTELDPATTDTPSLSYNSTTITALYEATGSAALDNTPSTTAATTSGSKDSTGNYTGTVTITLTASDSDGAGISKIQYSINSTSNPQTYTGPIQISSTGSTTIYFGAVDNLGNVEKAQTITFNIVSSTSSTGSTSTSSSNSSSSNSTAATSTSANNLSLALVNQNQILEQTNISDEAVLGTVVNPITLNNQPHSGKPIDIPPWILPAFGGFITLQVLLHLKSATR